MEGRKRKDEIELDDDSGANFNRTYKLLIKIEKLSMQQWNAFS